MASQIDSTKPTQGTATTESVRQNFAHAKSEIEALQTDVQTLDTRVDALEAVDPVVDWDDVQNKPATFPPSAHNQDWSTIDNKPTEFTPSAHNQDWSTIDNKPTEFTPSAHNQDWSTIDNKPTEFTPSAHTHDDRYYTEAEVTTLLAGKKDVSVNGETIPVYTVATLPTGLSSGDDGKLVFVSDARVNYGASGGYFRWNTTANAWSDDFNIPASLDFEQRTTNTGSLTGAAVTNANRFVKFATFTFTGATRASATFAFIAGYTATTVATNKIYGQLLVNVHVTDMNASPNLVTLDLLSFSELTPAHFVAVVAQDTPTSKVVEIYYVNPVSAGTNRINFEVQQAYRQTGSVTTIVHSLASGTPPTFQAALPGGTQYTCAYHTLKALDFHANGNLAVDSTGKHYYQGQDTDVRYSLAGHTHTNKQDRQTRRQVAYVTASLAHAASELGSFTIAKGSNILNIAVSRGAWVVLYNSLAARAADTGRLISQDPTPGSGVIAEIFVASAQTVNLSPIPYFSNTDLPTTSTCYIKVENRSGTTGSVNVTMDVLDLEY